MGTLILVLLCAANIWMGYAAPQNSSRESPGDQDETIMNDFQMVDLCESVSDQGKKEKCSKCFLEVADPEKDTAEVVKCTEHLANKVASCVKKVAESDEEKKYDKCNSGGSQQTLMQDDSLENSQSESDDDGNKATIQEEISETTDESQQPDEPNNTTESGVYQPDKCGSEYGSMVAVDHLLKGLEESDPDGFSKVMSVIESCVNVSTVPETLEAPEVEAMEDNKDETKVPPGSGKNTKAITAKPAEKKDGKNEKKAQGQSSTPKPSRDDRKTRRKREDEATMTPDEPAAQNTNVTECLVTILMRNEEAFSIVKKFVLQSDIPVPSPVVKVLIAGTQATAAETT